ncbi:hypothetical protein BC833DRAFT_655707 [Globomyces pollinis-pini]|nr:hypothetical protein BC833DRAFT_655707 [Globomyces pollinis-pini]
MENHSRNISKNSLSIGNSKDKSLSPLGSRINSPKELHVNAHISIASPLQPLVDSSNLYDQIGGELKIDEIVTKLFSLVLNDDLLSPFFVEMPLEKLKRMLRVSLVQSLKGVTWSKHMEASVIKHHSKLGITLPLFERFKSIFGHAAFFCDVNQTIIDKILLKLDEKKHLILSLGDSAEPANAIQKEPLEQPDLTVSNVAITRAVDQLKVFSNGNLVESADLPRAKSVKIKLMEPENSFTIIFDLIGGISMINSMYVRFTNSSFHKICELHEQENSSMDAAHKSGLREFLIALTKGKPKTDKEAAFLSNYYSENRLVEQLKTYLGFALLSQGIMAPTIEDILEIFNDLTQTKNDVKSQDSVLEEMSERVSYAAQNRTRRLSMPNVDMRRRNSSVTAKLDSILGDKAFRSTNVHVAQMDKSSGSIPNASTASSLNPPERSASSLSSSSSTMSGLVPVLLNNGIPGNLLGYYLLFFDSRNNSIYDEIGGETKIDQMVKKLVMLLADDNRYTEKLKTISTTKQKRMFKVFMTIVSKETTLPNLAKEGMQKAHAAVGLSDNDFDGLKQIISYAMFFVGTHQPVIDKFLDKSEKYRDLIIGKKSLNDGHETHLKSIEKNRRGSMVDSKVIHPLLNVLAQRISILEAMGGEPVLEATVKKLYQLLSEDSYLHSFFGDTDMEKQHRMQHKFLTLIFSGQPIPKFTRRSIKTTHAKLKLTDHDFDRVKALIGKAMISVGVSLPVTEDALSASETIRNEILGRDSDPSYSDLFIKIGGESTISKAIDMVYEKAMNDPILYPEFKKAKVDHIKKMVKKFLCNLLNGAPYNGRGMKHAHKQLSLEQIHFDTFNSILADSLRELKANEEDVVQVLDVIERLRFEVLGANSLKESNDVGSALQVEKLGIQDDVKTEEDSGKPLSETKSKSNLAL